MKSKKSYNTKLFYFILFYVLLWIVLFEFILPVNNFLPKPSIVMESFPDLWKDYDLPSHYLSTIAVISISIFLAYILVKLLSPYLIEKENFISLFINSLEWFSEFIPGIVIGLLLIFWFPESEYTEFIFALAAAFTSLMIKFQNESEHVNDEYITSAMSLRISQNKIDRFIIWNNVKPKLFEHLFSLHLFIWSILIVFEFIKGGLGLGVIFRKALEFRDLSAIFSAFIITGISVYIGIVILKFLRKKFAFWN